MTKVQVIIAIVVVSAAFVAGRQSVSIDTTKTVSQDTDRIKEVIQVHTVTTTTKEPTGAEVTTTTTDTNAQVKEKDVETKTETSTVVSKAKNLNVSVMVAPTSFDLRAPLTYGVSVNKELAYGITIGAFGLTNNTVGVTVGVNF